MKKSPSLPANDREEIAQEINSIFRDFHDYNTFNTISHQEVIKHALPLLEQLSSPHRSLNRPSISSFFGSPQSSSMFTNVMERLLKAGWNEQQIVKTLCPHPSNDLLLGGSAVSNSLMPLWMKYHHPQLMFSIESAVSQFPQNKKMWTRQKEMWEILEKHGINLAVVDDMFRTKFPLDMQDAMVASVQSPTKIKNFCTTLASGIDALHKIAPPSLVASYRVIECALGGRPLPPDMPRPLIWPEESRFERTDFSQHGNGHKAYDFQNRYIALCDKCELAHHLPVNTSSSLSRKM